MAEALGLISSIATLVELSAKIAGLSYSYARAVKNAPKTQKQYLQEVSALIEVLYRVEQAVVESESTGLLPARPPSLNEEALMDCYTQLSRLYFELERQKARILRPFQDRELKPHIDMLQKFRALFTDYLSSCILVTTTATYKKVSFLQHEQDRNLLVTWVPTPNIPIRQKPSPCAGTGNWFLESAAVQAWLSRKPQHLWCYGPPGVGKSYLASVVIDHILEERTPKSLVVYFFCDFSSQNQVKTIDILHHLLRQIVDRGSGKMLSALKESCRDPSTLQNATQVVRLLSLVASVEPIYLVIDGVDELKSPNELLRHIIELATSDINILVTSRDLPQIRKKLGTVSQLLISPSDSDLRLYISSRLQESDIAGVAEDSSLINDIFSKIGNILIHNIFLLSRLLLDELLDLITIHQIRETLQRSPQSLRQAFEASLQRVDAQPLARKTLGRRLLGWIMVAERRLELDEVVTAFAVEDGEELQPGNMPSPDILIQVCAGLVALNKHDGTLGLVHSFAYEVFRDSLPEKQNNIDVARTCLQYLSSKSLLAGPCTSSAEMIKRLDSIAFLDYSSKYWGHHVILGDCEKDLEPLVLKLLENTALRNSAYQALQFRREFTDTGVAEDLFSSLPSDPTALHLAAHWGLSYIASKILQAGASVSATDSHKWTPLHWACAYDRFTMVDLLLRNGADVNAQDIQGWTPLFWAAFVGSIDMVRLLLSNHANHLARSTLGWTALHWAISGGHTEIVKEILEHHARCRSSEPDFHTMTIEEIESYANTTLPIDVAAAGQDADIFTLLVEHLQTPQGSLKDAKFNMIWERERFDFPVSFNPWRTMTKGERVNGRESILPRFTGIYADDSARWRSDPKEWKSVLLLSAIRDQQLSSVELLVKAGADVNFGNALCVAACRRDPRYVQCLLKNGADPNDRNSFGRAALHEAVMNGFVETIAALLEGGADIDQPVARDSSHSDYNEISVAGYKFRLDDAGSTALIQAVGFSLLKAFRAQQSNFDLALHITELLISKGADTRIKDHYGRTALHYAVLQPYLPLVKLLVKAGCPVDVVDHYGSTPLHLLALHMQKAIDVQDLKEIFCLLLRGKYENSQTNLLDQLVCDTTTHGDEYIGDGKNSIILLKKVDSEGNERRSCYFTRAKGFDKGLTPISMALQAGKWRFVEVLLELGATFPTDFDLTPVLDHAIESIEPSMTNLLLKRGAIPSPGAIYILAKSLVSQEKDLEPSQRDHLNRNFGAVLEVLVTAGLDVNFCQEEETPLLLVASNRGWRTALGALINAGADVYRESSKSFEPILASAIFSDVDNAACLLKWATAHPKENHWSTYLTKFSNESDPIMAMCQSLKEADAFNRTNRDGCTLLHLAAEEGHITLVKSLVSCGAQADITDSKGYLAFHSAGFAEKTTVLNFLLEKEVKSSSMMQDILSKENTDSDKNTMLDVALLNKNVDMAAVILKHGMIAHSALDPNRKIRVWRKDPTVLGYAAGKGFTGIVSTLLQHGADIEKGDEHGWRPLHSACYQGHTEIVKILMEAGADIHATTVAWSESYYKPTGLYIGSPWIGQPLHLAVMSGQADIVKLLLERDVDIHASTGVDAHSRIDCPGHGPTALHLVLDTGTFYGRLGQALDPGRLQIAQWLVERGAMVRGVIRSYSLHDILKFRDFPDLWDALVAGDKEEQAPRQASVLEVLT